MFYLYPTGEISELSLLAAVLIGGAPLRLPAVACHPPTGSGATRNGLSINADTEVMLSRWVSCRLIVTDHWGHFHSLLRIIHQQSSGGWWAFSLVCKHACKKTKVTSAGMQTHTFSQSGHWHSPDVFAFLTLTITSYRQTCRSSQPPQSPLLCR